MASKAVPLALAGGGGIFIWSALKGKSWSTVLRDVISGQNPSSAPTVNAINSAGGTGNPNATSTAAGQVEGTANGIEIADDALRYQGHAYTYGGAPGPNGTSGWDCSSFVNWVLNHDLDLPIPGYAGGQWNPSTHGPATTDYLGWSGATTISQSSVGAGDLLVWETHMGIAINNSQMISALNPSLGTAVTTIVGGAPSGESLTCMRVA